MKTSALLKRVTRRLEAAFLLVAGLCQASAQTIPDFCSGLAFNAAGDAALLWIPPKVLLYDGTLVAMEVQEQTSGCTAPNCPPIMGVQGVVASPAGDVRLFWTADRLFVHESLALVATEVLAGNASIAGIRGVVWHPLGAKALIWTGQKVYQYDSIGGGSAQEVHNDTNIRGVAYHPLGTEALIWTATDLLQFDEVTAQVQYVDSPGFTLGVVYQPPPGNEAMLWTAGQLLVYDVVASLVSVIPGVSSVRGIAYQLQGTDALIWTSDQVFRRTPLPFGGTLIEEVMLNNAPITQAQGAVFNPLGTEALMWTPNHVLQYQPGNVNVSEVLSSPGAGPLTQTRGITFHPLGIEALIWTSPKVFRYEPALMASEVTTAGNLALNGARGIVYQPPGDEAPVRNQPLNSFAGSARRRQVRRGRDRQGNRKEL